MVDYNDAISLTLLNAPSPLDRAPTSTMQRTSYTAPTGQDSVLVTNVKTQSTFKPLKKRLMSKCLSLGMDHCKNQNRKQEQHTITHKVHKSEQVMKTHSVAISHDVFEIDEIDLEALTYYPPQSDDADGEDRTPSTDASLDYLGLDKSNIPGTSPRKDNEKTSSKRRRKRYRKYVDSDDEEGDPEFVPPKRLKTLLRKRTKFGSAATAAVAALRAVSDDSSDGERILLSKEWHGDDESIDIL